MALFIQQDLPHILFPYQRSHTPASLSDMCTDSCWQLRTLTCCQWLSLCLDWWMSKQPTDPDEDQMQVERVQTKTSAVQVNMLGVCVRAHTCSFFCILLSSCFELQCKLQPSTNYPLSRYICFISCFSCRYKAGRYFSFNTFFLLLLEYLKG